MNLSNFLANMLRVASGLPVEPPPVQPEKSELYLKQPWYVRAALEPEIFHLIEFHHENIAPLRGFDNDSPHAFHFSAHSVRDLYEKHGPGTLNQLHSLKAEYEKFTPQIKQLVRLVSGGKDSDGFFEKKARFYIFDPSNDPQASIDQLTDIANILDRAVKAIYSTKEHSRQRKYCTESGKKLLLRERALLDFKFKKDVWGFPVEEMKPYVRGYLESYFDLVSFSDAKNIKQVLQRVFQEYEAPVHKSKPKKIKPSSPVISAQPLSKSAAQSSDIARAHEKLDELLAGEEYKNEKFSQEIQENTLRLPSLQSVLDEKFKNLIAASDIRVDLGQKLFFLLNNVKAPLVKKLSELVGKEVTGYETPDAIATLAAPSDEVVLQVNVSELCRQEAAHVERKELSIRHFDVDAIIKCFNDASLLQKAKQILDLRASNLALDFEREKITLTCLQLERRIVALELKAVKMVDRSVLIEAAIAQVQDEIKDLQDEVADVQNTPLRDAVPVSPYPPLSQLESWVNENLNGRVRIHRLAFNAAADPSLNHRHPEWIYEGLKLLANEYWDQITSGDADFNTAQGLRAAFRDKMSGVRMKIGNSISTGDAKARAEYFVTFDGKRLFMDQHLARGISRDPANHMRIYFTWDNSSRTVLVGHLPTHLSNSKD